ncbi:MAG: hypothetical protein GY720_19680 [bacterium]|nr:hypothetical protein [bacterium]
MAYDFYPRKWPLLTPPNSQSIEDVARAVLGYAIDKRLVGTKGDPILLSDHVFHIGEAYVYNWTDLVGSVEMLGSWTSRFWARCLFDAMDEGMMTLDGLLALAGASDGDVSAGNIGFLVRDWIGTYPMLDEPAPSFVEMSLELTPDDFISMSVWWTVAAARSMAAGTLEERLLHPS